MSSLLVICLLLPLSGLVNVFFLGDTEKRITKIATATCLGMAICTLLLLGAWLASGMADYEYEWFMLYAHGDYKFPVSFFFDQVGAVFLIATLFIFSIIIRYCRYYLHRDPGYKRFFITIFGFVFGMNLIILAGTIDVLFAGWEIVGISSFLLIAFYRERPQPIRNALRTYSVYRLCDIGLLLGAWMSHLIFHSSQHFIDIGAVFAAGDAATPMSLFSLFLLSSLIIIAASGKSAQFPFCYWLPRAMEGPTPSSAIFYGALSVHLGVFLLMRTMPIWSYYTLTRALVFVVGLLSFMVGAFSSRAQSNIKGQIAYASIEQVGLMFIELALGLETLALVHFFGNAFLRCYQLLVSPSIVAHLLRIEGAADTQFEIKSRLLTEYLPGPLKKSTEAVHNTLYVLALQEVNLERLVRTILWDPLKRAGYFVHRMDGYLTRSRISAVTVFNMIVLILYNTTHAVTLLVAVTSAMMVFASLSGFSEKYDVLRAWNATGFSCILAGISVWFLDKSAWNYVLIFFSGILPAWVLGVFAIRKLTDGLGERVSFFNNYGLAETQPLYSFLLFISFLALAGFPITPAFLGEDLLLSQASHHSLWLAAAITFAFVINGVSLARVFVTLTMGGKVAICLSPRDVHLPSP
jgi:NADH:ubiquinone oxidoreductase subunit 5 (subunit L)/multisubunit Na+/H+ antiporter MnhA subunit